MTFTSFNPANGLPCATYPAHEAEEVEARIERAFRAQRLWAQMPLHKRSARIIALANALERHCEPAARLITKEMGKPLAQSRAEVLKCASVCRYMAQIAPEVLSDQQIEAGFAQSLVVHEPLGTVFSIMPWNFPLWQFFRFAAPALIGGNAVLVKHAPSTMGCGMIAVRLCHVAGLPEDLIADLRIDVPLVEQVLADDRIHAVTFTGSTQGGAAVAALAGKYLKKSVMELGGSDPYIICQDAELDRAVAMCVTGRTINSGQSCIAAKRFIVHTSIAGDFVQRVAKRFDELVVGDPHDIATDIGPLARRDLKDLIIDQVSRAKQAGARVVTQRSLDNAERDGFFVSPTLLVDVEASNPAFTEELFGPVATVTTFDSMEEAVYLANATSFGLGAAVCSQDVSIAHEIARKLHCGTVFINDFVRSDARLPFGGVKKSGYGRELGRWGMLEFVNVKNITTV